MSVGRVIARQLAKAAFGWMGTARHLVGPSLYSKSCTGGLRASSKSLFPHRVLPTDVLLNRIFIFQRTTEVNVPLFNPTENRVLSTLFSKIFSFFLLPDSQTSVQRYIRTVQSLQFPEMTYHSRQTIEIAAAVLVSVLRVQARTPAVP